MSFASKFLVGGKYGRTGGTLPFFTPFTISTVTVTVDYVIAKTKSRWTI